MPIEQSAFRYGIRFSAASYVIRVTFNGTTDDIRFPVTGTDLDPTVDYFFMEDGSAIDLCELLADAITSHGGGEIDSTSVVIDPVSLELELTVTPLAGDGIQILWSHANTTLDATIFGWTNDADSDLEDTTILSPNLPMGLIYLDRPVSVDSRSRQPLVGGISRSISGLTRASTFGTPRKERSLTANLLPETFALDEYAPSNTPYATFESMHVRAAGLGRTIHFIPDATLPLDYIEMHLAPPLVDNLRRDDTYRLRWSWNADYIVDAEYVDGAVAPAPGSGSSGGSGGAPTDATYVVMSADSTLTAERVLTAGNGILLTDGGANSTATLAVDVDNVVAPNPTNYAFGWLTPGHTTTEIHEIGLAHQIVSGTLSLPTPTSTSGRTSQKRWRMASSAAANVHLEARGAYAAGAANKHFWRGDAANLGGFLYRFLGLWFDAINSDSRGFFGLSTITGLGSSVWSGNLINCIGFGFDYTDTNWQLLHNDSSGAPTQVDLGANFPKNAGIYDFSFSCTANAASISYTFRRVDTGNSATGTISTDMPASTDFMAMFYQLRTSPAAGSTAAVAVNQRANFARWGLGY